MARPGPGELFARYLSIASGDGELAELDEVMAPTFIGHVGERTRDLAQLKHDITAYRAAADGVRFRIEHQFSSGDFIATRVSASAIRRLDGSRLVAAGINISRFDRGMLAEEWAVWEPLHPIATP